MVPHGARLTGGTQDEGLGGDGGGVGSPAVLVSAPTSNEKGPKSFFRLRVLPCRKLVAVLAVGLCVLAGEQCVGGQSIEAAPVFETAPKACTAL